MAVEYSLGLNNSFCSQMMTVKQKIEATSGFVTLALGLSSFYAVTPVTKNGMIYWGDTTSSIIANLSAYFLLSILPTILLCIGAYFHARYQKRWGM
jgi:hypothetical protein